MSSLLQKMVDGDRSVIELKKFEFECALRKVEIRQGRVTCESTSNAGPSPWYLLITRADPIDVSMGPFHGRPMVNGVFNMQTLNQISNIQVRLCLDECPASEMLAKFCIVLKRSDREVFFETEGCFLFSQTECQSHTYTLPVGGIQPNEEFKICVTVHAEDIYRPTIVKYNSQLQSMKDFLVSLQSNDECSDVVIKVNGKEIKCHKCILSCRSLYFATLFKSGLSESVNNKIEIIDFDYETIEAMINFLYVFECPELGVQPTMKLLEAAHKYQITDLETACEDYLVSKIDTSNALDILLHADVYSAQKVRKRAIDFILKNRVAFEQVELYEPLISRPHLLRDMFLAKLNYGII